MILGRFLSMTGLDALPVRVRHGINRGARWTLYPHSAYWRGSFEPDVQAALQRYQPPAGSAAWDLGAHFGFYTLALARMVGQAGSVLAVEPDPASFSRLCRHLQFNGLEQVRAISRAASDRTARQFLVQTEGSGATTSHLAYPGESVPTHAPGRWIETVALDELRIEGRLPAPAFIKIDVEGHGAKALAGARASIAESRPRILMSLHSPDETRDTANFLSPLKYRPHDLDGSEIGWENANFRTVVLLPD